MFDKDTRNLDLDNNYIASIPAEVFGLTQLLSFSARENNINIIPSDIGKLTTLESLWLHENKLVDLPTEIGNLKRLKDLWVHDNQLVKVPSSLGLLSSLTDLRLDHNKLSFLPHELGYMNALVRLSFGSNQVMSLPPTFAHLTNLTKLHADFNKIGAFPQHLPKSLTSIDLSNNLICGEVPSPNVIKTLTELRKLKLSGNYINIIPTEIGDLTKLEVFTVATNELLTLPSSLGKCTALRILELDNNNIDYLPPEIPTMTRLEKLGVSNTAFLNVPNSVVKKGLKGIVKHFEEFRLETRNCTQIKLMVVGQENVGKTTLLQALRNTSKTIGDHSTPLSTDGIDIATWKVKLDKGDKQENKKAKKIEFSCWDFAGQEVYYNTHQFFLSKSAIYVLVWNMARPDNARLDFWLESIEGSGGGVVAMVGTHLNDPICTQEYLDTQIASIEENWLKKYPNIRTVCLIDAKKGTGIIDLKQSLVQIALTLPQFGKTMPPSTVKLEEALSKEAKQRDPPIMTWQDYQTLATSCSINDDDQLAVATQFLHNLGSLIHFPSRHSGLSDLVILKPQFLPNLMCTVVSTQASLVKNGVLMHKDLNLVWKKYQPKLYPQFILLLEKFGIMCRLQEEAASTMRLTSSNSFTIPPISPKGGTLPKSPKFGTLTKSNSSPSAGTFGTIRDSSGRKMSIPLVLEKSSKQAKDTSLDAEKSLVPLLLGHNPEIDKLVNESQGPDAIGREFHFRIAVPALFPRLIVSILMYSRLANRGGSKWKVLYGKDQLFVGRGGTFALAALNDNQRTLSVIVWGKNKARMLTLITQSIAFLLGDCFPNYQFHVMVLCPHCLSSTEKIEPKSWPLADLEARLLDEGDMSTVMCEKFVKTHRTIERVASAPNASTFGSDTDVPDIKKMALSGSLQFTGRTETTVLIRDMVPDLALTDVPKIMYSDITIEKQIGEGAFGEVFQGTYNSRQVAVKTLHVSSADNSEFREFVHEASFMGQMDCPHIVTLLGVSLKPLAMIQEFMNLGDLQKYLQKNPGQKIGYLQAIKVALDIARGCQFLHSRTPPCIHADLKSPNILLCQNENGELVAKLGDLGLSRSVFAPLNKRMVDNPRWLAPEILSNQEYNEMADVYSYAIILWEIITTHYNTYQEPFQEYQVTFDTILESHILQGTRPTIPLQAHAEIVNLICECWEPNYFERPSFDTICAVLHDYLKAQYSLVK